MMTPARVIRMAGIAALGLISLLAAGCQRVSERTLTVSAAISLSEPMGELAQAFQEEQPGVEVVMNHAGSGALAAQIRQGAEVDVFVSAGPGPMDLLESEGRLVSSSRRDLIANQLALVGRPSGPGVRFSNLADWQGELALGDPKVVPAGAYAQQVLSALGTWPWPSQRLVIGESVRQVLTFVETGQVPLGLVYRTDAAGSHLVEVLDLAPPGSHEPIRYPGAVVAGSREPRLAQAFLDLVASPLGQAVLMSHGFLPLE